MTYGFTFVAKKDNAFLMNILIIDVSKQANNFPGVLYHKEGGIIDSRIGDLVQNINFKDLNKKCREFLENHGYLGNF